VTSLKAKESVNLRRCGEGFIIDLFGDFSDTIEDDLNAAYEEACQAHSQNIVLKFDEGGHIYSSGIALLVGLVGEAEDRGQKIHATGLSEYLTEVFEVTALTKYIQILPSEQDAVAILTSSKA
jgi:anti-anti-sigma factor